MCLQVHGYSSMDLFFARIHSRPGGARATLVTLRFLPLDPRPPTGRRGVWVEALHVDLPGWGGARALPDLP